jgi:hypothetical protein
MCSPSSCEPETIVLRKTCRFTWTSGLLSWAASGLRCATSGATIRRRRGGGRQVRGGAAGAGTCAGPITLAGLAPFDDDDLQAGEHLRTGPLLLVGLVGDDFHCLDGGDFDARCASPGRPPARLRVRVPYRGIWKPTPFRRHGSSRKRVLSRPLWHSNQNSGLLAMRLLRESPEHECFRTGTSRPMGRPIRLSAVTRSGSSHFAFLGRFGMRQFDPGARWFPRPRHRDSSRRWERWSS